MKKLSKEEAMTRNIVLLVSLLLAGFAITFAPSAHAEGCDQKCAEECKEECKDKKAGPIKQNCIVRCKLRKATDIKIGTPEISEPAKPKAPAKIEKKVEKTEPKAKPKKSASKAVWCPHVRSHDGKVYAGYIREDETCKPCPDGSKLFEGDSAVYDGRSFCGVHCPLFRGPIPMGSECPTCESEGAKLSEDGTQCVQLTTTTETVAVENGDTGSNVVSDIFASVGEVLCAFKLAHLVLPIALVLIILTFVIRNRINARFSRLEKKQLKDFDTLTHCIAQRADLTSVKRIVELVIRIAELREDMENSDALARVQEANEEIAEVERFLSELASQKLALENSLQDTEERLDMLRANVPAEPLPIFYKILDNPNSDPSLRSDAEAVVVSYKHALADIEKAEADESKISDQVQEIQAKELQFAENLEQVRLNASGFMQDLEEMQFAISEAERELTALTTSPPLPLRQ
jgi:hypothetical protein